MLSLKSTSKAVGRLITSKNGGRRLIRCLQNNSELENCVQSRCFKTIGINETIPSSCQTVGGAHKDVPFSLQDTSPGILIQKRRFLGCGDGDEGSNVLSKVHEEKRIMGYSPEQLFAVVAAVDMYQDFLPWCQRSDIVQRHSDSSFDAELEIGFKFLVESYISHVQLVKPKMIKTTSSQSSLFDHLINIWEFNPGPVPGTCDLHFFVDFKFQSPLYSQAQICNTIGCKWRLQAEKMTCPIQFCHAKLGIQILIMIASSTYSLKSQRKPIVPSQHHSREIVASGLGIKPEKNIQITRKRGGGQQA